jgi:hypothetical protein
MRSTNAHSAGGSKAHRSANSRSPQNIIKELAGSHPIAMWFVRVHVLPTCSHQNSSFHVFSSENLETGYMYINIKAEKNKYIYIYTYKIKTLTITITITKTITIITTIFFDNDSNNNDSNSNNDNDSNKNGHKQKQYIYIIVFSLEEVYIHGQTLPIERSSSGFPIGPPFRLQPMTGMCALAHGSKPGIFHCSNGGLSSASYPFAVPGSG